MMEAGQRIEQLRGLRAYATWAIVLLVIGGAIIAATLLFAVDLAGAALTGDIYGRRLLLASTGAVATPGIAVGVALIAIASEGRRDGNIGRWKLWAKLQLVLGGTLCVAIPLLIVAAGEFGSVFADIALFFGWIPILLGAVLIVVALMRGRRPLAPKSDAVA